MSTATVENILTQINQLPASERAKVIAAIREQDKASPQFPPDRIISVNENYLDRTLEYQWLAAHRREYIGEWIALKADQLVAHGTRAKDVFAQARAAGINDALVLFVEDPDIPYIGI
jgi:hypothetical protein